MTSNDLINQFQQLQDSQKPLRLINTYRGVSVISEAKIMLISQGYITVKVSQPQAVCMTLEGRTFIQAEEVSETVSGQVVTVDILQSEAVLTDFKHVGHSIGKRMSGRVQPKEPTEVRISYNDQMITGIIADISAAGIGVFTFTTYIYGKLPVTENTEVGISVTLPGSEVPIQFQGIVSSTIQQEGSFLYRLGIKLIPDQAAKDALLQYITCSRAEIEDEIIEIYKVMVHQQKIASR